MKNVLAALLASTEKEIILKFIDVQRQSGGNDCGLFSIAYATAICFGKKPGNFNFDQDLLRPHLIECFKKQKISMFPVKKQRRIGTRIKGVTRVPVYCSCRMPSVKGINLIQCYSCREWFHLGSCVNVPQEVLSSRRTVWKCCTCMFSSLNHE